MKKMLIIAFTMAAFTVQGQTNKMLDQSFWKNNPGLEQVKTEIANGGNATELNFMAMDPTVIAINNNADAATIKFLVDMEGNGVKKLTHDGRTYLHWAAGRGNAEVVEYLISKGADINLEDSHRSTPIAFAAGSGMANSNVYDAFIKAGLDVKKKYRDGANLLLIGVANDKDLKLTDYFVSKGLSLNSVDDKGNTAFNYATRGGDISLLKTLVKRGVKYSDNALLIAAEGSRRAANGVEMYQYLVEELKLKANQKNQKGETVLHLVAGKPKQQEVVNYFIGKGLDVNAIDNEGTTVLMVAAAGRDTVLTATLIPKVKNVNALNAKKESALTMAVRSSTANMVNLLLKNGADAKVTDSEGNNLAYYLVQSYRPEGNGRGRFEGAGPRQDDFGMKKKALQQQGLNFAAPQKDGNTLYHLAVAKGDLKLLKSLENLGLNVNAKNKEGITPLHRAAMISKDDAILKYLLSVGAQKELATEFEETAYSLAQENGYLSKNNVSVEFLK